MFRFLQLLLLGALIALVISCGEQQPEPPPVNTPQPVAEVVTNTPESAPTSLPEPTDVIIVDEEVDATTVSGPPPTLTSVPTSTPLPATNTPTATATPTETPTPVYTPTPTVAPTWTPGPRNAARPSVNASPGNPQPYLSRYQLVAFYGSPWGRALGILGNYPRKQMTSYINGLIAEYQPLDSRHAMCAYHMVTTVANTNPPEYRHVVDLPTIEVWIASSDVYECANILDIQPGRMTIQEEFERIKHFLYHPHTHMAIDPEFDMGDEQIPNIHIGHTPAVDINWVQGELQKIAMEIGVNKVLILHQFKDSMLPDKQNIQNYPNVELVIDSDGTFRTDVKMKNYWQYAAEPAFEYGGIKHFFVYDDYLLTPAQTQSLNPRPAIIIYQ